MTDSCSTLCTLADADRRHVDALSALIECKTRYCHPEFFRLSLNNCLQTLRSVTFVLQALKGRLRGFSSWYPGWQERMAADPVMCWAKQSRNRVVKEGDLETHSIARVGVVDSWYDRPSYEADVSPLTPTELIAGVFAATKPDGVLPQEGLLRVDRRWVEKNLPEWELLEALAHVFGQLALMLIDAHEQLLPAEERAACKWYAGVKPEGGRLPPCMIAQEWDRTVWIDLADGQPVEQQVHEYHPSPERSAAVAERYGGLGRLRPLFAREGDLRSRIDALFEQAKVVLQRDGYHHPLAFLRRPDGKFALHALQLADRSGKYLIYRALAADVAKTGATSIFLVGEVWISPLRQDEPQPLPENDAMRVEALDVTGADSDGEVCVRAVVFHKDASGSVVFDDEIDRQTGAVHFLEPFFRVWGVRVRHQR